MAFVLCALTMGLQSVNGTSGVAEMQIGTNFKNEARAFFSHVSSAKELVYIA